MRYGCECSSSSCRERLSLSEGQYAALAKAGAVLSAWCALREGKPALVRCGDAVAVRTSEAVRYATRRRRAKVTR